jgi:Ribbon-helix-helix protein, copG family
MRTTLSLDEDVAAALERVRRARKASMKSVVNEALRQGLGRMAERHPQPRKTFQTRTLAVGRCLVGNIDNIAEVLAIAEGEPFK